MKINLSKEHIKKGCEFVDDYDYRDFDDYIHDMELGLYNETYGVIIDYSEDPLYRDFLQLVIEWINDRAENSNYSFYIIQFAPAIRVRTHELKKGLKYIDDIEISFKDNTIVEAKEKAITCVFENMDSLK